MLVDPPAPSCTEGQYLPRFLSPTPRNGERLHASPDHELEIRVKATATHSTVHDVIISGPLNITKHRLSTGEFLITWTPTTDDFGDHFPICFIAESSSGGAALWTTPYVHNHHHHQHHTAAPQSDIYQSEMRCVIVEVGQHPVKANVICTESNMVVEVEKSSSVELHAEHLRLNDPHCTLASNDTHVLANISLNACGTMVEEDDTHIRFRNEIVSFENPNAIITRRHEVEIEFYCEFQKNNTASFEFTARRGITTFTEKGFGTFSYQFELFDTDQFIRGKDPNSYPVEYDVGDMIYMQIASSSSLSNTELFVESCIATPYNDPNYPTSYSIIKNGCIKDETVQFYTNHQSHVQFGMEAFKFIGLDYDQVFISCSVILCEAGHPNTRCSQGCVNATASPSGHHHHRREAPIQTASHSVSQGPLRLRRSEAYSVTSNALNLNLVFIAGCLLAVVGMVCGVVIYRSRKSEIKYQPLPASEI